MRASRLNLPPPPHAGLALQRYLKQQDDENASARELLTHIANSQVSTVYRTAFERWKESLKGAIWLEATTRTPLAIGLGNSSPLENGLALHHTYGTPYLPGSALKGLLRRVAERYGLTEQEKAVLLGEGPDPKRKNQGNAAYLVYWDGWLDPASSQPFQSDVITVHHREYYGKKGAVWPTDFDDPNPVAFLSVKPGVKFCIPITSPAENAQDWPYKAAEMLKWGLENLGLGGKTNAGYGYFTVKPPEKPKGELELGLELLEGYRKRIAGIKPANERGELDFFLRELADKPPALRKPTLEALKKHLQEWKVWKTSNPQHARIQELLDQ
ncbi:type III-B CRISPR module RAMP protein Cmr6 [Meiothermus sp. CFH 77666]|uniref:type III-B CRISPR module RAMP protein Cmr6 n=1 Tax=Meiothermus sp. CFH 77666 TaxID=2817942 RepID=UPI001AA015C0|nr:type III-B CRISPR module RAMP protein Cmr6 [Meiothermus sp. CFH 77666]MBO1437222.1 type III-B CRISPR module RAMP protein Cmr6 [Meiothermus sp. CFH 77666]